MLNDYDQAPDIGKDLQKAYDDGYKQGIADAVKHGRRIKTKQAIWCAEDECIFNEENQCMAEEINLSAGYVHTKHQGYAHKWECRTFQMTEEVKTIYEELKSVFDEWMEA